MKKKNFNLRGSVICYLHPLSIEELHPDRNLLEAVRNVDNLLVFGSYPDVANHDSFHDKIELLKELSSSYLYKDILEFQLVRNSDVLLKLLKALSFQIGSEVSCSELSNTIGIDKKTVGRYIDLLEKNFIVFRLPPYSTNRRKELSKLKKIYFYDLGIRNAIINNFNFIEDRNDAGALWENLMVLERLKYREYHGIYANQYFWRTYDGAEVDLVEERDGRLFGFEFKRRMKRGTPKAPSLWAQYPDSSYQVITDECSRGLYCDVKFFSIFIKS